MRIRLGIMLLRQYDVAMQQSTAVFRRWCDVLALGAIAAGAGILLHQITPTVRTWVTELVSDWHRLMILLYAAAVSAGVGALLIRLRGIWGINTVSMVLYPPTYLAVLIAAAILWSSSHWSISPRVEYQDSVYGWASLIFCAGLVVAASVHRLRLAPARRARSKVTPGLRQLLPSATAEQFALLDWLAIEEEVRSESQDRFSRRPLLARLRNRILSGEVRSIAVVGPRGCGKTSVLRMLEEQLRASHGGTSVWLVTVDAWGITTGQAATEYILTRVVDELSRRCDCIRLTSLPRQYREALSGAGSSIAGVAAALSDTGISAVDQLRRVEPILAAHRARLLVVIEDLDRGVPQAAITEIEAMLDRLREVDRVTFVLSWAQSLGREMNSTDRVQIDLARLCDHTEILPPLDTSLVWQQVGAVRDMLLSVYEHTGEIDPVAPDERSKGTPRSLDIAWIAALGDSLWTSNVCRLLSTPRTMKAALRRTATIWARLHGEIDPDHTLICCALREGAPEVYNYLLLNGAPPSAAKDGSLAFDHQRKAAERERAAFDEIIAQCAEPAATGSLVALAFADRVPQGVGYGDYWARLNAEEHNTAMRDQEVLRCLRDCASGKSDGGSVQRIAVEDWFAGAFEHFADTASAAALRIPDQALLHLTSKVLAVMRDDGARSVRDDGYPGFYSLWRLVMHRRITGYEQWLISEWELIVRRSLMFATTFAYYWASGGMPSCERGTIETMELLCGRIEHALGGSADTLLSVLDAEHPYACVKLRNLRDEQQLPPACWAWLARTMLEVAQRAPAIVVPELAYLFSESKHVFKGDQAPRYRYRLNATLLAAVFPERDLQLALLRLLAGDLPEGVGAETAESLDQIRSQALTLLSQNRAEVGNGGISESGVQPPD